MTDYRTIRALRWAKPSKPTPVTREPEKPEPKYKLHNRVKNARWVARG